MLMMIQEEKEYCPHCQKVWMEEDDFGEIEFGEIENVSITFHEHEDGNQYRHKDCSYCGYHNEELWV
jgi:Zn-finger nucleic acid-binding protein